MRLARGPRHHLDGDVRTTHPVVGGPVGELSRLRHAQAEGMALVTDEVNLVPAPVTEPADVVGRLVQSLTSRNFPLDALKMIRYEPIVFSTL